MEEAPLLGLLSFGDFAWPQADPIEDEGGTTHRLIHEGALEWQGGERSPFHDRLVKRCFPVASGRLPTPR